MNRSWATALSLLTLTPWITSTCGAQDAHSATENPIELWQASAILPDSDACEPIAGAEFRVIKRYEPDVDGYHWLHGVALAMHRGSLFASFGHNRGLENTVQEQARYVTSSDLGKTWSKVATIDSGNEENLAISHGVFCSHEKNLWAFHGAFFNRLEDVHTRGYRYDDRSKTWVPLGKIIGDGFWPMQEPLKVGNRWIMAGLHVVDGIKQYNDTAAVAISEDDDFTTWRLIKIPRPEGLKMWGESTVFVEPKSESEHGETRLWNIARFRSPIALASFSDDAGESWSPLRQTNLPMAASKPYAGTLADRTRFLVATTTADSGNRRSPLTIALGSGKGPAFERINAIRKAVHSGPGESGDTVRLSYPYAIVHDQSLLIGYSNDGGRGGNRNSAELAIIPLESLKAPKEPR